jgi:hypothetical protein
MRPLPFGLIVMLATAAGAEPAVTFPGPVAETKSPASDLKVTYVDPGENEFQAHDYSLRLVRPDGRSDEVLVFTRSVDVSWSPSGSAISVTDHVTDKAVDCYVFTPGAEAAAKVSMTDVVTQGRFPAPAWALQHSSHGVVVCDGWAGPDQLRFYLDGAGDDTPRGFHYGFIYDVKTGTAKLDRPPASKTKRSH